MKIKFGSSRFVIIIHKWAIKIPFNKCGIEQSINEKKLWDKYERWPLNPIIKSFGTINIFPKTREIKNVDLQPIIKETEEIISELIFEWGDLRRKENWGELNGKIVLIDYGLNTDIEKKYYG
jgi:hypothetical protein